ncbi:MAG: hypothetical protein R3A79_18925 [Nannocystaceae bacterium]
MLSRLRPLLLVLLVLAPAACNPHPFPLDPPDILGISVPIPPPSLTLAPVQAVDIDGDLGLADPVPETLVYLYEHRSDKGYFVFADDAGAFTFNELELDLSNNCMQVWFEEPGEDGQRSEDGFLRATIAADDQSVEVEKLSLGCG